jgi:lysophospholipase L1-like esterase
MLSCHPCLVVGSAVFLASCQAHAGEFQLKDGDRVIFLGNTLIEREQRTGYWETMLTSRYPDKNITFRNLGWSGDTVWGDARASFGTAADGFRELKEHVFALKPTVIFVGYGGNEAFAGKEGLPRFLAGLRALLDTLAETKARLVLLAPIRHEDQGYPLRDARPINKLLALYRDGIRQMAKDRGYCFVDLYKLAGPRGPFESPWTENGMHLSSTGYYRSAGSLAAGLGLDDAPLKIEIDRKGNITSSRGIRVKCVCLEPFQFQVTRADLPKPPPPPSSAEYRESDGSGLHIRGLPPGNHRLVIDGKKALVATADMWQAGEEIATGPDVDQAERLRQAIVEKNLLYFHRWRPENETYLFGFRKHEQGQNAREIPQFDPLVARKEAEIARLRVPVVHTYELSLEEKR